MSGKLGRKHIATIASGCIVVLAWGLAGRGQEQKPNARPADDAKPGAGLTPFYWGVKACADCHNSSSPREDKEFPPLCRCTEVAIWKEKDKHQDAYKALQGKRAQQMSKLLGYDVAQEASCLACHAAKILDKKQKDEKFSVNDGVSCAICHGPYDEWSDLHGSSSSRKRKMWRDLPRDEKEAKYGMTDLWNPAKRTKLCVSCHVGSQEEGKVVTHDMYAAGHPPLPSIETATFSEQMPAHWELVREKKPEVQELLHFNSATDRFELTKLVAVSSVATLRETMKSLALEAAKCADARDADHKALDLASFDCYACHHDLKSPSWRQKRYVGKPGRPQMRQWPTALVTVALRQVTRNEQAIQELDAGLAKVYQAFSAQPFGDCIAIASASSGVAAQLARLTHDLNEAQYDAAAAERMLRALASLGEKEILDYDTARQIAWAFQVIYKEWQGVSKGQDAKSKQIFAALGAQLKLELPKRPVPPHEKEDEFVVRELPDALSKLNDYDPDKFKEIWKKVSELIPSK